jgi:hypothetical protein
MPLKAKVYIASVLAAGVAALAAAAVAWSQADLNRLLPFVAMVALASALKLRLPVAGGAYSLNAVFLLVGAVYYSLPETVAAAAVAGLVGTLANTRKRPSLLQVLFNASGECASLALCWFVSRELFAAVPYRPALLALIAALYFAANTTLVAGVLALSEGKKLWAVARQWYSWAFPFYLAGAAIVGLLPLGGQHLDGGSLIVLLPVIYLIHFFCGLAIYCPKNASEIEEGPAPLPPAAKAYLAVVIAGGVFLLLLSLVTWNSSDLTRFLLFLALAVLTATWKVRLPGMTGAISVNYVVVLFAIATLSLGEAVLMSAAGAVVQTLWRPQHRPKPVQVWFNLACFSLSTGITYTLWHSVFLPETGPSVFLLVGIATGLHYGLNTILVAAVLTLVERRSFAEMWRHCHFWAFPHYMVGALAAGMMIAASRMGHWSQPFLFVPLLAMAALSYAVQVREHGLLRRGSEANG